MLHPSSRTRRPDFGPQSWDETTAKAAAAPTAPPVLIAYNVNVPEPDARVAKMIERSSEQAAVLLHGDGKLRVPGMLDSVQGMGVMLEHKHLQVSMN